MHTQNEMGHTRYTFYRSSVTNIVQNFTHAIFDARVKCFRRPGSVRTSLFCSRQ